MRNQTAFILTALAAAAIMSSMTASAALADKPVDETRPADPTASVSVENLSGSVRVKGWDRAEVKVTGSLGDDTEGLTFGDGGGDIHIEVEIPEGRWGRRKDVESHLEIWVPSGASLEVETVSASIDVNGVNGELELSSVSGGVDAQGGSSEAELETVSGSISFSGSEAAVSAESVSGSIRLEGIAGQVEASSVSGRIKIDASVVRSASFESVSGSIDFTGRLAPSASMDVEAHSSNVTLSLPADTSARFEVSTFSGRIENDFGPDGERTSRFAPGYALDFTTGSGDSRISVESFSGTVYLARQ